MRSRTPLLIVNLMLLAACQPSSPAASQAGSQPAASTTASATSAATETSAASATAVPESVAPSSAEVARIFDVECLTGQTVRLHVEIWSETGIESYGIWSTWGGGGEINQALTEPFPTEVEETFEFTHTITDPEPGRVHQFGLSVQMVGTTDPILTYEIEPDGRCPGH